MRVLLNNVTEIQTQAEGNPLLSRQVSLTVAGLPPGRKFRLQHFRVDNTHSNVQHAWKAMGQPDWPSSSQLAELHEKDALEMLEPARDLEIDVNGQCAIQFEMPMPSLSLLVVTPVK